MPFRILTLNIQNGQPWNEENPDLDVVDINAVARFLIAQDADIICLQEVERGFDGGMQIEPPPNYGRLREMLKGYDSVFSYPAKNETEIPFGLGLAIFSKTKLREFERIDLPAAPIEFEFAGKTRRASQRLLIGATVTIDGLPVRIMNAHLQAFFMIGTSSDQYPEQRNIVEALLRKQSGAAILAGDMNSTPEEGLVAQFRGAGFSSGQCGQVTWKRRPYVVDHIFHNAQLRQTQCKVVETEVSDHHALLAEFELS
jgi:endonuclease/exonuclease/phosphatase family metal-dependent hydrolase